MRKDDKKLKKKAYIIDTFIQDEDKDINTMTANKVIEYYKKILKLSDRLEGDTKKYDEVCKYIDQTIIDEKKQTIKIIKDNKVVVELDMIYTGCDWSILRTIIKKVIEDKMKVSEEDKFGQLRKMISEKGLMNKKEYKKYALKHNLEIEPETTYYNNGWKNYYDFLGIDISLYPETFDELKKICKEKKINDEIIYYEKCKKYKLPEMPEELYINFTTLYNMFNSEINKRRV